MNGKLFIVFLVLLVIVVQLYRIHCEDRDNHHDDND